MFSPYFLVFAIVIDIKSTIQPGSRDQLPYQTVAAYVARVFVGECSFTIDAEQSLDSADGS